LTSDVEDEEDEPPMPCFEQHKLDNLPFDGEGVKRFGARTRSEMWASKPSGSADSNMLESRGAEFLALIPRGSAQSIQLLTGQT